MALLQLQILVIALHYGYVKECRNAYSHATPDSNQENFGLYIHATIWMRMFLTAMLLEYCGMPINGISAAFSRNHEYSQIAAKLSAMLHS